MVAYYANPGGEGDCAPARDSCIPSPAGLFPGPGRARVQHVHISFISAVCFWLYILIGGTAVRLLSAWACTSSIPLVAMIGKGVQFQY